MRKRKAQTTRGQQPTPDEDLFPIAAQLTQGWFSKDFTVQAHAEWDFIELYRENPASRPVFVRAIHEYLLNLLTYEKDIYTEDRIRVAARVICECKISDVRLAPVLIQLLGQLAVYGTHYKPVDALVRALRGCWHSKYAATLKRVIEKYPRLKAVDVRTWSGKSTKSV